MFSQEGGSASGFEGLTVNTTVAKIETCSANKTMLWIFPENRGLRNVIARSLVLKTVTTIDTQAMQLNSFRCSHSMGVGAARICHI